MSDAAAEELGPTSDPTEVERVLAEGEIELQGRVMPASNLTFFGESVLDGVRLRCVYKPISGERPLWDFPDGSLAGREVAAYTVSEALGWDVVPRTILRDGPAGTGMVQVWCEPDPDQDPVDLVPAGKVPPGCLQVLEATDHRDRPVDLVHEDSVPLRRMAVFDVVVNNADRKGGHVLPMADGHRYGVDHGISFHRENKLRTVLWGWAGEPLHPEDALGVEVLLERLGSRDDPLGASLEALVEPVEVVALLRRCRRLLDTGTMPLPSGRWPAIPWPAF